MLFIDRESLRTGLDRAIDVFRLHRLSRSVDAEAMATTAFAGFGVGEDELLVIAQAMRDLLPATGDPLLESLIASSMGAGVLVGLLIADAASPATDSRVPDFPPADL